MNAFYIIKKLPLANVNASILQGLYVLMTFATASIVAPVVYISSTIKILSYPLIQYPL